ncbi:hypothetical protein DUNSADRAFT_13155 [Dunaliella salina]|uniref:Encoded protein n=1 Tax=Dunaliella salina TaxID=3046 RepID=A0ABQ7G9Z4_DUNSA|nr:hypothetical protein DUNSADRAFT_13155 [Dunaliella salina]|eukprot:KAF5831420.1 hypothetical protein DUNSADRAFT_13155 [Dunaliella salina]
MNMAAASPTYTLAIQMPPPGALPDTFQPQLSSGLDVSHPAQINSASIPISSMPMPTLSAGEWTRLYVVCGRTFRMHAHAHF